MKPFRSVLMVVLATCSGTLWAANDVWTSLGPEGGAIERLAVDPQNPSTVYAVAGGGVFKTVNGGATWSLAISALTSGSVRSLVINPQNPSTLFAVAGARGLKSTDGGMSWNALNSLPDSSPAGTYTLAVDPRSGAVYARTCNGVARSKDGGESWEEFAFPPPLSCFAMLVVDPSTGALYTTRTTYTVGGSVTGHSGRIFKSEDGGETWNALDLGVTSVGVVALAIDPQNSNTIYALAWGSLDPADYHYQTWLFKTNDGGASWVVSTGLDEAGGVVAVDPQNPNTVYLTTRGAALRSTDGGTSWKPFPLADGVEWFWSPNSVTSLAIAPSVSPESSSTIYVGTYTRGVWKSADEGRNWAAINSGLTATNVQSLQLDPQNPGTLYGVLGGVEIVKTSDRGMTWRSANSGLPKDAWLGPLAIDPQNTATLYAATNWKGLFRTDDGGASWEEANLEPGAVNGITIDPQNSGTLYAGIGDDGCWEYGRCYWSGVFKSVDGGASWSTSGLWGYWVGRVAVAPLNSNLIYGVGFLPRMAGGASNVWEWGSPAFFKSINGGASWDVLKLPTPSIDGLAINPQEPSTAYVYGYWGSLLKTNDGGESWIAVDLPSVRALAVDPQTPTTLYAGTESGVFRSIDGGASWTAVNSGLTSLSIATLAIDPQNPNTVFAGTSGGGVFSITFTSQVQ